MVQLSLSGCDFKDLDLTRYKRLKYLSLVNCGLKTFDFNKKLPYNIERISLDNNQIKSLDPFTLKHSHISLRNNLLTELPIFTDPVLHPFSDYEILPSYIYLGGNPIKTYENIRECLLSQPNKVLEIPFSSDSIRIKEMKDVLEDSYTFYIKD